MLRFLFSRLKRRWRALHPAFWIVALDDTLIETVTFAHERKQLFQFGDVLYLDATFADDLALVVLDEIAAMPIPVPSGKGLIRCRACCQEQRDGDHQNVRTCAHCVPRLPPPGGPRSEEREAAGLNDDFD